MAIDAMTGEEVNRGEASTFFRMSDIHVNFLNDYHLGRWAQYVGKKAIEYGVQSVIISGDISEAPTLVQHLKQLRKGFGVPIYYVPGNHDYWRTDFDSLKSVMSELNESGLGITWLGDSKPIALNSKTALIGHECWYDAMAGDWTTSNMEMRDWELIHDFIPVRSNRAGIVSICRKHAGMGIVYLDKQLDAALALGYENIIVATHFPPFTEAARYHGAPNPHHSLPWYTCTSLGGLLVEKAQENRDRHFLVLAGHTHDECRVNIEPNLSVHVKGATYGNPSFELMRVGH